MVVPVLQIIHPNPGDTLHKPLSIEIVAVHGLVGDARSTWKKADSSPFWLQDYLPHDVEDARVFTYGYDACSVFQKPKGDNEACARRLLQSLHAQRQASNQKHRPLIFIAHCFGGILVKQALELAYREGHLPNLNHHTIGIVFFGTPHRCFHRHSSNGFASLTTWTQPFARELNDALVNNKDLLKKLRAESEYMSPHLMILSFCETQNMDGWPDLIVKKEEALLESAYEISEPVKANHDDICKFDSRSDQTYKKLYHAINGMIEIHVSQPPWTTTVPTLAKTFQMMVSG